MKISEELKVAIVCDWLTGIGGAELVVLELHKMFPNAPIYTSQYDPTKIDWFKDADVRTTWVNKFPKSLKKFLPVFRAMSFSKLNLSDYDLVISSTGAEAKAVKTGPKTTHVCYCNSPTHYYWMRYNDYLKNPGFGALDWLARIGLKLLVGPLRKWDYKAAQKPKYIIANSTFTQQNIKKYYNRDSSVIHPPVDIDKYKSTSNVARSGFIVVGRQTPYKRIDLAVEACTKNNLNLIVIGNGPENKKLKEIAGPSIKFLGQINDIEKAKYLRTADAFIFPGVDDFGIAAIEALAAGTPVIAYGKGGVLDYVNQANGLVFDEQSIGSITTALNKFKTLSFDHNSIQNSTNNFSIESFKNNFLSFLDSL